MTLGSVAPEHASPVVEIKNLSVTYHTSRGALQAVTGVNLSIGAGEIVGLVGESGSGKSTLAFALMRLLKSAACQVDGEVVVEGQDLYRLSPEELRQFRWSRLAMVFQSAMNALNPVLTVEDHMADTLRAHRPGLSARDIRQKAEALLDLVRIDRARLRSYPHELSGGMRQRVVIALALALDPSIIIMDEPTTALDVVVQRSILDEIRDIQRERQFAALFISHDFSLVAELASRVAIMYAGRLVEVTDRQALEESSQHHPYTRGLLRAIPRLTEDDVRIEGIPGSPPDLIRLPPGCAFHPRCPERMPQCSVKSPLTTHLGRSLVECHLFAGENQEVLDGE